MKEVIEASPNFRQQLKRVEAVRRTSLSLTILPGLVRIWRTIEEFHKIVYRFN
jgi:hypothetical protein